MSISFRHLSYARKWSKQSYLLLFLSFVGCSGTYAIGDRRSADPVILQQLIVHKTTKDQVRDILGDPFRVTFPDLKREIWSYWYSQGTDYFPGFAVYRDDATLDNSKFTVEFDARGVVTRYARGTLQ